MPPNSNTTSAFAINPTPTIQVDYLGPDRVPLIQIDNVTIDQGQSLVAHALKAQFEPEASFMYPGVRAPLPTDYVIEVLRPAIGGLYQLYNIPKDKQLRPQQAAFSLISRLESQLSLMQTVPHFDTPDPHFFAVLHYLSPGEHGSTGFFQHVPTGLYSVTQDTEKHYFDSVKQYFRQHGEPPKDYITGSSGQFKLYHQVDYKPNRLVIYPGNLLHSTLVKKDRDISADPAKGRLTANIFVRFV
ncbi:DUF6445 family protein [Marinimicrobium sp. ABcell2]|uniref:DUF6445 family protein n=1 Tax=Marinimicrobium sp. ABcell2 TaxID=3069751 RepID=UPI0027B03159|nr:DUF6445 family protein [Marinimicrobium sp. ABcell2]MDQ2075880.1 DUF6445 family protein [Marinimicrobium sp. ABcell2]